jgi:predicted ArsR family transcriptional regulator
MVVEEQEQEQSNDDAAAFAVVRPITKTPTNMLRVFETLVAQPRMTTKELAKHLDLSVQAVRAAIHSLEKLHCIEQVAGVRNYHARTYAATEGAAPPKDGRGRRKGRKGVAPV